MPLVSIEIKSPLFRSTINPNIKVMKTNQISFSKSISIVIGLVTPSILALDNIVISHPSFAQSTPIPLQKTCRTGEISIKGGTCFKNLTDEHNFMIPVVTPPFRTSPVITPPDRISPVFTSPAGVVLPSKSGVIPAIH